ncbi:putative LexA repressor [Actinoplanes missouriensis 431]|uniref:Putative LexA repressor n=1 Tax=Actinoplanes missouriensis (strain ATCC 14538 / DSM 43046 / CBS 188.64 / JCM 3121 / NBRC 102363 / NCIMB 12654 / NRRL B-3342 / UNCC 431) TaxID=512565 RepID=I0H2W3_ACTM4|nr:winged helix-turn-helix transcriptional regulator [Actinoplanes missouriensis]BAL87350.1 putative LexA repressor [Actinoplanes missouriensis 431]
MTAAVASLLTKTQRRVLEAIRSYATANGFSPTFRDISEATGLSVSAVSYQVGRLSEMGWIRRAENTPRALVVLDPVDGTDR